MSDKVRLKPYPLLSSLSKRNINQSMFAYEECMTSGYFTMLLKGQRYPSASVRQNIMEATGLSWDELFELVQPEDPKKQKRKSICRDTVSS